MVTTQSTKRDAITMTGLFGLGHEWNALIALILVFAPIFSVLAIIAIIAVKLAKIADKKAQQKLVENRKLAARKNHAFLNRC